MGHRLVKLENFSGSEASIYAVMNNETNLTSFDEFIKVNNDLFKSEINDILIRLQTIGHKTGARESFFKLREGFPGDGVCALYDKPKSDLRLYCIRYGRSLIILGGGGPKSKKIKALQDDEKLTKENYFLRKLSNDIKNRTTEGEISLINEGMDLEGNLNFDENEY